MLGRRYRLWSAIIITCKSEAYAKNANDELEYRKKIGIIDKNTITLAVEDPQKEIGSGGATINALLVISELLSVKYNYSALSIDVLKDCHILIIHMGRIFPYDPCCRGFTCFPLSRKDSTLSQELVTNFDCIFDTMSFHLAKNSPPGVWVCSSDMLLNIPHNFEISTEYFTKHHSSVVCISSPGILEYATKHGVYKIKDNGAIDNLLFQGTVEEIKEYASPDNTVNMVSGIIYFPVNVAEKLLSLHLTPPLDACTYYGADNGVDPLNLSLFFDIILCMVESINERDFVAGKRSGYFGKPKNTVDANKAEIMTMARSNIWKKLNGTKIQGLSVLGSSFSYLDLDFSPMDYCNFLKFECQKLSNYNFITQAHSFVEKDALIGEDVILINSLIESKVKIGDGSVLVHCHIPCGIEIPSNCFLFGLDSESFEQLNGRQIKKEFFVMQTRCSLSGLQNVNSFVIFPININLSHIEDKTIEELEIGHNKQKPVCLANKEMKSIMMTKMFPILHFDRLVSLLDVFETSTLFSTSFWSSFNDILQHCNWTDEFKYRHVRYCEIAGKKIEISLKNNKRIYLANFFQHFVYYGLSDKLLKLLDSVATQSVSNDLNRPDICARALACVADVLDIMAPEFTLLRSGPSLNKVWQASIKDLKNNRLSKAVIGLAKVRDVWTQNKMLLIRSARHYEGAAQILIGQAVLTVNVNVEVINLRKTVGFNRWLVAESPARLDFSGGWSDTPPICYEHGGVVVNAAVLINGKRPIGARVRKIIEPKIVFRLLGENAYSTQTVECEKLSDLSDFELPCNPGALLKACVLLTRVVNLDGPSLKTQLFKHFGGGFELQSWSNLPHGSGLGTSSILAGTVLKVLFSLMGVVVDTNSIIHAVMVVEQMLTTGGGWQDQIGGLVGGIKISKSSIGLPLTIKTEQISCSNQFLAHLNSSLKLIYTGKTRLARNLLQNVIRNWYRKSPNILNNCQDLVENAERCKDAFKKESLNKIGVCIDEYWKQKKIMAPGSEPLVCSKLFSTFKTMSTGSSLAGAGGGGFMYLLLKEDYMKADIESLIKDFQDVIIFEVKVDDIGMVYYEKQFS